MDAEEVLYRVEDGVAWGTRNRPHRRNAMTRPQRLRVIELIDEAASRLDIRAIVLTGSEGSFCTGADLGAALPGYPRPEGAPERVAGEVARGIRMNAHRLITAIMDCEKPVIAAVNGIAAGMGVQLALACDLVLMSADAVFYEAFADRGIVPDTGAAYLLGRLLGPQKAKELLFFGARVTADEAVGLGLANLAVAPDAFEQTVSDWARRLAAGPTSTIALTKLLVNKSLDLGRDAALALEAVVQDVNMTTADAGEGIRAFIERRPPEFQGW